MGFDYVKDEALHIIDQVEAAVKFDMDKLRSLGKTGLSILGSFNEERRLLDAWGAGDVVPEGFVIRAKEAFQRYDMTRRLTISSIYSQSNRQSSFDEIPITDDEKLQQEMEKNSVYGVDAFLTPEGIFVKTPMLCKRVPFFFNVGRRTICRDHLELFASSVRFAIQNADGFLSYPFADFDKKTVHFLFVYGSDSSSIIDNDNHDTKSVSDAITWFLPGGDAAVNCVFLCSTVIDSRLPEGAYVTATKGRNTQLPEEYIIKKWRSFLAQSS